MKGFQILAWIAERRKELKKRHRTSFGEWCYTFGSYAFRQGYRAALADLEKEIIQ